MAARVGGRRAVGALGMLGVAVTLMGGETMRESAPSGAKVPLDRNGRPIDPLLERLVNATPLKPGRDESTFVNPFLTPKPNSVIMDPQVQRQWKRESERQRNWLLENAARIANPDKSHGVGDAGRTLPLVQERPDAESSASARYFHARDAALANEARRGASPEPGGLAGRTDGPASSLSLDGADPRDELPLDTRRIIAHGGDPAAVASRPQSMGLVQGPLYRENVAADIVGPASTLAEARKTAMEERNAAFETLLEGPGPASPSGPVGASVTSRDSAAASLDVIGLETRRAPASRARQFDAMLAGGEPGPSAMGTVTRSLPPSSTAPSQGRVGGLPELGRSAAGANAPAATPAPAPRPSVRRLEPQPVILELPRFNQ